MLHSDPLKTTVYLGLGANLGDRDGQIHHALARLSAVPGVAVEQVSTLRDTAPFGVPAQPDYRNGVARLITSLPAMALLAVLKQLEAEAGRDMTASKGAPRPLDLDLLLYGDQHIDHRDLVVPHPRMMERNFVLEPLRELGFDVARLPLPAAKPELLSEPDELVQQSTRWLEGGCTVGLVPTMGALHEGHGALVARARQHCDRVLATIFVNPLQFGAGEDFERYPRTLDGDRALLARHGCDAVFVPDQHAMYGPSFCSYVTPDALADELEGASRPGHFRGVATVVAKLFAMARPTDAFFGRKDAQQVAILRRMTTDLAFPIRLHECPTVREHDGLALSSRNRYLAPEDRAAAPVLFMALDRMRGLFQAGQRDPAQLLAAGKALLADEPRARLDYLELRAEGSLAPLPPGEISAGRALVAAWFGSAPRTRLIDNLSLGEADLDPRVAP